MPSNVLALIPARVGSKGIPGKNWKPLAGRSPLERAYQCASVLRLRVIISTDAPCTNINDDSAIEVWLWRPAELAQDDTPMIDVVKHALAAISGPEDQIICLLQPTQPLRKSEHIRAAIALLESSGADSVVSVVELPQTHNPEMVFEFDHRGRLSPFLLCSYCPDQVSKMRLTRRQDVRPAYIRDGTVYTFRRATVVKYGNIYGQNVRPLLIPPDETCPLDTEADWLEAERRLRGLGR